MSKPLVSDDLWEAIAPLLPREQRKPKGGRPRCDDRLVLAGIIFVLRSGIPWEMWPARVRVLRHDLLAQTAGLADSWRLEQAPSGAAGMPLGCGTAGLEPCLARQRRRAGEKGGAEIGPNPTDRGKAGTKRHLVVDRRGTPLGVRLSPANRHDSLMLAPTLDAVPEWPSAQAPRQAPRRQGL